MSGNPPCSLEASLIEILLTTLGSAGSRAAVDEN